jgi:hypothetical protein
MIIKNAYSHGVSSGGPGGFPYVRLEFEQFSNQKVDTGQVIKITGTVKSITSKPTFVLSPYVSVDTYQPFDSFDINGFPRLYYPLRDSEESWYFKIDSNLTNPVILEPGQTINYEIRVIPLKAGMYHIHSYFLSNEGIDRVGPGQTVQVNGSAMPTVGEIVGFYLPLAIGATTLIFFVPRARRTANELGLGKIRKGIKIFFAVESSLEAIWLSGLVAWLVLAAYHVLQPIETRLIGVIILIAVIGAITVGGFIIAGSKNKKHQNGFAVGLASASAIFYFLLQFGSPYYLGLSAAAFGYNHSPFELDPLFLLVAILTNANAAALLLWNRKEGDISSTSTNELATRQ